MIMKQTREYKEPETETEPEVPAVEEPATPSKKPLKKTALVFGIIAVILVVLGILVYSSVFRGNADTPGDDLNDSTSDISGEGDDDYWAQFETTGYTVEEKESLRAWGYTGTEIEQFEIDMQSVDDLIAKSKQKQEETMAALSDVASPEYQRLLNLTWLGQNPVTLPSYSDDLTNSMVYTTLVLNADFEKIPAHGHSLFLKVYLEDGSYVFMECPVTRYMQLPDNGNIVVQYDVTTINGVDIISGMREVPVE